MSHANIRLNIPPTFTSKDSPTTILPPDSIVSQLELLYHTLTEIHTHPSKIL